MAEEEVGSLRVGLSLDSATFDQSLKSVDRNIKALGQEMSIIRARGSEWGNSIEGLGAKQGTLSALLESQDVKVRKLNESYQRTVEEQGANSTAAENLAIQLNRATAEMTRTETELGQVTSELARQQAELERSQNSWVQLGERMNETGDRLQATGEKMKKVGSGLSVGVTAPLLAVGAGAIAVAAQFDESQAKIQAALGTTSEEADKLKDSAQAVWKDGFGESLDEVTDALIRVKQNMKDVTDSSELEKITRDALALAKAFDSDVNEVTRAGNNIMKNFGVSSDKAFDLMAKGAQNGLNFSNEMFDNLAEYAPLWADMGYSAEEMFGIIERGAKSGVYNLDYVNDVMKEFQIRMQDGSKATSDAMAGMLESTQDMFQEFNAGKVTVADMSKQVAKDLKSLDNQVDRNVLGVGLFGTKWEDLGGDVVLSMLASGEAMGDFDGAMNDLANTQDKTFGQRWNETLRTAQSALLPVGDILLDIADEWLPKLSAAAEDALQWFEDLGEDGQKTALAIGGIAAAAGPVLVVVGSLTTGVGGLLKVTAPLVTALGTGTGLAGIMTALTGPVGLATLGIGGLGLAVGASVLAYKEANEVNIEVLEAKQKEIAKNDELIDSFDALRSKNELSNEQMLRYLDIQAELEATTAPEKITALKDEQAKLLEKSALTNDEMDKFLGLNDKVIEIAPSTVKAISSQGEAYALNTGELKLLNAEKAKELENASRETLIKALDQEKGLLNDQKNILAEINEKNTEQQEHKKAVSSLATEIIGHEKTILDLEKQKNGASAFEITQLDTKIRREKDLLIDAETKKIRAEEMIVTNGKQIDQRQEMLGKNRQELAQLDEATFKYEEIILAQAGITAEKGRGGEQLNEELKKLDTQKVKLSDLLKAGKIGTAEYQEQNGKIDTQIGKLKTAKSELQLINDVAGKTVFKDINLQENPRNFWDTLDDNLRRPITKTVSIRYNNMNGPQEPGFAVGTRNAPGGMAWVGEEGPELMYVPSTSKIIPNNDSMALLNKWNIPTESSNSNVTANADPVAQNISIAPAPIYLDGQVIAEVIFDTINSMQYNNTSINAMVRGVSL